jgi:hypothetical protein
MWSDPIENTLLQMREALDAIQRGHDVYFGELDTMLVQALRVRATECRP